MNYEEKLREIINSNSEYYPSEDKAVLAKYFPELQESEDERIKREILEYINSYANLKDEKIPTEWLEWLEKQSEFDDNIITRNDEILQAISVGLTDVELEAGWSDFGGIPIEEIQDWLEKQGEQKPIDHNEDEKIRKDIIRVFKGEISFTSEKENEKYITWLEKQGEKKSADEVMEIRRKSYSDGYKHGQYNIAISLGKESIDALEHFVRSIGESGYASPYDNRTKLVYRLLEQLKQIVK